MAGNVSTLVAARQGV